MSKRRAAFVVWFGAALAMAASDSAADERLLTSAGVATDGSALLEYFRQRTLADADRAQIERLVVELGDPAYEVRERASAGLVKSGIAAATNLRRATAHPDVEVARRAERCLAAIERVPGPRVAAAAARLLAARPPDGAAKVLLAFVPWADDDAVADEVREAIAAAVAVTGGTDPAAEAALADPNPVRRAAAAEALVRTRRPAAVTLARRGLSDTEPVVRLRTAMALVSRAHDRGTVPTLIHMLAELPPAMAWSVDELLTRLAGDKGPVTAPGDSDADRRRRRDAWLAWWDRNGQGVDLTQLDQVPTPLGYTLVVVASDAANAAKGRIVEMNAAGETLWEIGNLDLPVDAIAVGRDRVLIAEFGRHEVSERLMNGGLTLWKKGVAQPVAVRRLPNGHTFVVARNQLLEWGRDREEIFTINRPLADIRAAEKASDGTIVVLTVGGKCLRIDPRTSASTTLFETDRLTTYGSIDLLPGNRALVTRPTGVAEFPLDGPAQREAWSVAFPRPTSVQRLASGNTLLVGDGGPDPRGAMKRERVVEVDRNGRVVWEMKSPGTGQIIRARRR